jgi:hypothetical protein
LASDVTQLLLLMFSCTHRLTCKAMCWLMMLDSGSIAPLPCRKCISSECAYDDSGTVCLAVDNCAAQQTKSMIQSSTNQLRSQQVGVPHDQCMIINEKRNCAAKHNNQQGHMWISCTGSGSVLLSGYRLHAWNTLVCMHALAFTGILRSKQ